MAAPDRHFKSSWDSQRLTYHVRRQKPLWTIKLRASTVSPPLRRISILTNLEGRYSDNSPRIIIQTHAATSESSFIRNQKFPPVEFDRWHLPIFIDVIHGHKNLRFRWANSITAPTNSCGTMIWAFSCTVSLRSSRSCLDLELKKGSGHPVLLITSQINLHGEQEQIAVIISQYWTHIQSSSWITSIWRS